MKVFNAVKTKFRNCRLFRASTSFPDIHNLLHYTHFKGIFASTSPFSKGHSSVRFPYQFYLSSIPAKCSAVRKVISASVVVGRLHQLFHYTFRNVKKGKTIPLQTWTGPKGSRRLRLPDFKTIGT